MRYHEFVNEWKEAYLYHATSIPAALSIWQEDALLGGTTGTSHGKEFYGASTTRNYNYALGYLRGSRTNDDGGVVFWIDQDLVKQDLGRRRLKGYDWFWYKQPDDLGDQFQFRNDLLDTDRFETVITKGGLKPFRKYVKKIEIFMPKTSDPIALPPETSDQEKWDFKMGIGKYAIDPTNPDKFRTNIRYDQSVIDKYTRDPIKKKVWDAILKDPRTEVKATPGMPKKQNGIYIYPRRQYDQDHPMYGGGRW